MPDRYGDRDVDYWPPRGRADESGDYAPSPDELAEHEAQARDARRVPCRYCGAPAGRHCRNKVTNEVLKKFITHPIRITDAHRQVPPPHPAARLPAQGGGTAPPPDDDEELF